MRRAFAREEEERTSGELESDATFDALEHLPDLLLAAMAVDGHLQHEGLQIQEDDVRKVTLANGFDGRRRLTLTGELAKGGMAVGTCKAG
jgi:hypothetical protein